MQHRPARFCLRHRHGLIVLLMASVCAAQTLQDSLRSADSTAGQPLESLLTGDSVLAVSDSLAAVGGVYDSWWIPTAVILFSAGVFYLLFSVRSK